MAFRDDLDAYALRRVRDDQEVELHAAFVRAQYRRLRRLTAVTTLAAIAFAAAFVVAWPRGAGAEAATQVRAVRYDDSSAQIALQQACIRRALHAYHEDLAQQVQSTQQYVVQLDLSPMIERCLR
jgi:hypothetical protein